MRGMATFSSERERKSLSAASVLSDKGGVICVYAYAGQSANILALTAIFSGPMAGPANHRAD